MVRVKAISSIINIMEISLPKARDKTGPILEREFIDTSGDMCSVYEIVSRPRRQYRCFSFYLLV